MFTFKGKLHNNYLWKYFGNIGKSSLWKFIETVNLLELDAVLEGEGTVEPTCFTRKPVHKGNEKKTSTLCIDAVRHRGAC